MRNLTADILDLVYMFIFLCMGAYCYATAVIHVGEVVDAYEQVDKTALHNYSGRVDTSFSYSTDDVLFMLAIADRYEPAPYDFKCGDMSVNFDPEDTTQLVDGYNFIDCDRVDYIKDLWNNGGLKDIVTSNKKVTLNTRKNGGTYKWYATMTP